MPSKSVLLLAAVALVATISTPSSVEAFSPPAASTGLARRSQAIPGQRILPLPPLRSSPADTKQGPPPPPTDEESAYEPPEDAIIQIKPKAMARLVELKQKRDADAKNPVDPSTPLVLRMGVRNGGCSGLSYVMDFSTEEDIEEEDEVDTYDEVEGGIRCVVDAKSLLYLYGLELDYSDELIGGGFQFFNPNAEDSCGCGSSFGV